MFGYLCFHPASGRWLIDLAPKDSKGLWEEIGKTTLLGGGLLAALAPPLVGLYNAVRAFGLEPKRLLGSLAVDAGGAVKAEPGVATASRPSLPTSPRRSSPRRWSSSSTTSIAARKSTTGAVGLAFRELAAEAPDEAGIQRCDVGPRPAWPTGKPLAAASGRPS